MRDNPGANDYCLNDCQLFVNSFSLSMKAKCPLLFLYAMFLSLQTSPVVLCLSRREGDEGWSIDAAQISLVLDDYDILFEDRTRGVDVYAEASSSIIRDYGSMYNYALETFQLH